MWASKFLPKWPRESVAALGLCLAFGAHAEERDAAPLQVWLSPGIYSAHFDQSKGLRNGNPGLSAEVAWAEDHSVVAGTYINSNSARTRYAAYGWRPLHWELGGWRMGAGVALGAFDGYPRYRNGGWFIAPLPLLSVEGERLGVNLSLIPTIRDRLDGAVAFQFKIRLR